MSSIDRPVVFITSPYAGSVETNVAYAQDAMRDSLERGEAPYAPHLLYPQVLADQGETRKLGMLSGKAVLLRCDLVAVYVDLGESSGMRSEVTFAVANNIRVERRRIGGVDDASDEPTRGTNVVEL